MIKRIRTIIIMIVALVLLLSTFCTSCHIKPYENISGGLTEGNILEYQISIFTGNNSKVFIDEQELRVIEAVIKIETFDGLQQETFYWEEGEPDFSFSFSCNDGVIITVLEKLENGQWLTTEYETNAKIGYVTIITIYLGATIIINGVTTDSMVIPDGMIGYWTFDEANPSEWCNQVNGSKVAIIGEVASVMDGVNGKASGYAGNGMIELTGGTYAQDDFTISLWVKDVLPNDIPTRIFSGWYYEIYGLFVEMGGVDTLWGTGRSHVYYNPELNALPTIIACLHSWKTNIEIFEERHIYKQGGINIDNWLHVAYTYNSSNHTACIYLNGEEVSSYIIPEDTYSYQVYGMTKEEYWEQIRYSLGGDIRNDRYVNGSSCDELMIFNRSLEAEEVYKLYENWI